MSKYDEAIKKADIIVFLVAHKEFSKLVIDKHKIVLDYCGINRYQTSSVINKNLFISFIVCGNGYGHFKRVLLVCESLLSHNENYIGHIFCSKDQKNYSQ